MQTSLIRKLLHPIKELTNRRAKKSSAETLEQREESDKGMQNAECRVQSNENVHSVSSNEMVDDRSLSSEYAETKSNASEDCPHEQNDCVSRGKDVIFETSDNCSENMPTESAAAPSPAPNTRAHLTSSVPRAARIPSGALTKGEISEIRNILGNLDDAEIQRLYKRVTK